MKSRQMKKPKVGINKKKYFIANGEPFSKFVKHVEATRNRQTDKEVKEITDYVHETVRKAIIKPIMHQIDRNNAWDKLR